VDTAITNSFILYNDAMKTPNKDLAGFRSALVDELLAIADVDIPRHPRDCGSRGPTTTVEVDGRMVTVRVAFEQHQLYVEPDRDKRADCIVCKMKTNVKCLTCDKWYCLVAGRNHWAVAHQLSALQTAV